VAGKEEGVYRLVLSKGEKEICVRPDREGGEREEVAHLKKGSWRSQGEEIEKEGRGVPSRLKSRSLSFKKKLGKMTIVLRKDKRTSIAANDPEKPVVPGPPADRKESSASSGTKSSSHRD